ncbi:MAG TPA: TetR/AcrR family transcriptional regulator [bacterium]|jgi:TetR/AcrR family fatty acid metabolism transcriptional regulator|nr:TetR/AcrR family transcriptional regulator [bacterium]
MVKSALKDKAQLEESRRTQILEAASKVFARRGFHRATIAEIAKTARLSEGSIYNYFRSKEDLLVNIPHQLLQPVLMPLLERMPVPDTVAEAEELLTVLTTAMVERVRANAKFLKVFLSALPTLSAEAKEEYVKVLPIYAAELLERFLREGMRRGLFRKDLDAAVAARALPGMLLVFLIMQEVLLDRPLIPQGYDQIVPEVVRIFLFGTTPGS